MKTGKEAKESILNGINTVANAVKSTAGAKGKFALIQDYNALMPHPTKDGVTVLREIDLKDSYEKMGADLLKESALKTSEISGDGTTTTTILAQALINKTFASKKSHIELIKGMQEGLADTLKELDKLKKTVGETEAVQIATISANGDKEIGEKIAEIYRKTSVDATIEVKEGISDNITVVYNEGLRLDRGWMSPYFATDYSKGITKFDESLIVIFNGKVKTVHDIAHSINFASQENRPLVILANEVEEAVLIKLVNVSREGNLQICVCTSPEYGSYREDILEDISFVTGASIYDGTQNTDFIPGTINQFTATRDKSIILVKNYDKVAERIALLEEKLSVEDNEVDKDRLKKRISNLKSSVVEITVGGVTDLERKEKKDRVEDAVPALRVALKDGFISGGGSTLNYIANKLYEEDKSEGYKLFLESLKEPMNVILNNGGVKAEEITKYGFGVDVLDGENKNMLKAGIIDPVTVTKTALENAVSVASVALSVDTLILTRF